MHLQPEGAKYHGEGIDEVISEWPMLAFGSDLTDSEQEEIIFHILRTLNR